MNLVGTTSDEPTRLREIVTTIFRAQSSDYRPRTPPGGGGVGLVAGADAQDDCAVLGFRGDLDLVVGSDYVRGPKFRLYERGLLTEFDLGYYLIAANVSDIAAMGARPLATLTVVRYPLDMSDEVFGQVLEGIRAACADFGAPNVGGDIGGAERLILSATALGVCAPGAALLRGGARPGDHVCLTAPTGVAGAAMAYLRTGDVAAGVEPHRGTLLRSWTRPQARVRAGVLLGDSGVVTSCQDTSDGLKATVESIAAASGVGITIDEVDVPTPVEVTAVAEYLKKDPLEFIMGDSVDFELVFTVPDRGVRQLREAFADADLEFHTIGVVTEEPYVILQRATGEIATLPGMEWRHTVA